MIWAPGLDRDGLLEKVYSDYFFSSLWNNNIGGKLISPLGVKAFCSHPETKSIVMHIY